MQRWALFALFLLFGTLCINTPVAFAEEEDVTVTDEADIETEVEEEEEEEEGGELIPSIDVKTSVYFPEQPDGKVPLGDIIVVLVSFFNTGSDAFNVTNIGTSLHSPYDYSYFIQNFTASEPGVIVGPEQQVTLEYRFRPDPALEPVDFLLSGYVTYSDSGYDSYKSIFYNDTIVMVEKPFVLTPSVVVGYSFVIFTFASVAYVGLAVSGVLSSASKKVARVTRSNTSSKDDAAWGAEVYNPSSTAKVAKKSRGKGKKNK